MVCVCVGGLLLTLGKPRQEYYSSCFTMQNSPLSKEFPRGFVVLCSKYVLSRMVTASIGDCGDLAKWSASPLQMNFEYNRILKGKECQLSHEPSFIIMYSCDGILDMLGLTKYSVNINYISPTFVCVCVVHAHTCV